MRRKRQSRTHNELAALAKRQYGVVSIRQLTGPLGYSEAGIRRAVSDGRLHRLHRGVYAVGHTRLTQQGHCLAAVLACGRGALLSHDSAAWLWGISTRSPRPYAVTTPNSRKPRPPIRLHVALNLAAEDRALREGIPVTSLARTSLDVAANSRPRRLQRMIERSEELRLFDLDPVESVLERNKGHHGAGPLRRALALYKPAPFNRSGLERRFLILVKEAGLPQPATGFNEVGFELDVYWPEQRFAVELDTYETHGSREAFERDRLRQEELKLAGIELVRVTGTRLDREPEQVIHRIARLLSDRAPATGRKPT
jgi:Transcriptional regulator, AbiEi antitoxin/REase_MTES_1575